MNWRNYLGTNNPVAAALMAKMQVAPEDRLKIKMECLRLFVTLKLNKKKTRIITEFMNNYLKLTRADALKLHEEIKATMPTKEQVEYYEYIDPFTLLGIEKGEARAALRILRKKFGQLEEQTTQRIESLELEQLENLSEALLDFQSKDELTQWLDAQ